MRKQWQLSQKLSDMFWKRWLKEYAPTLLVREKWNEKSDPLQEGDIVLIVDNQIP